MQNLETSRYAFGPFRLDVGERQLSRDGVVQPLRGRPFDLLAVLVARAGELVSKDELLDLAWPGVVVEENNLQVQVSVLRKLLGAEAIATVPGRGYRFQLPVVAGALTRDSARGPVRPRYVDVQGASMFGRDEDRAAIQRMLDGERQVTIVGAGGIGKTRLARAVAGAAAAHLDGRVAWVDLAAVADPDTLASHVALALGVEAGGRADELDAIARSFGTQPELLVLDNAEHLVQPVAALVAGLLERAPALRVLVTSQAPLRTGGEHVYRLEPLPVPPTDASLDAALRHASVALLEARVRAMDRHFVLQAADVPGAATICRRLDGIPLAIELAAARVPLLGLSQLAQQLDERFEVLRSSRRDAPTRQQTLEAVVDWSHGLLSPVEQTVFRRLAVFAGAFDLDQAGELASGGTLDAWVVLDALATLVDRSLVTVTGRERPLYRLLETPRAYALRKLERAGERDTLERGAQMHESAGDAAALLGRNAEALAHLSAAMDLVGRLPKDAARDARELSVALKLGPLVQAVLGPAHPRCEAIYRRALACVNRALPSVAAYKAVWGYWHFLVMRGRHRDAAPLADHIVAMAHDLGDDGLELEAHHAVMTTQDVLGDVPRTLDSARRVLQRYDRERHHALAFAFGGHDPGVCACGQGALASWLSGDDAAALDLAARGTALADGMSDGYSRATGYYYACLTYAASGRHADLGRAAEALVVIAGDHGMESLLVEARLLQARARFDAATASPPSRPCARR
jgi:predicted ATPase/DNA-binding winged helix-turn-helix (wHTH) protein